MSRCGVKDLYMQNTLTHLPGDLVHWRDDALGENHIGIVLEIENTPRALVIVKFSDWTAYLSPEYLTSCK
mgnify:CR=1 FL=1